MAWKFIRNKSFLTILNLAVACITVFYLVKEFGPRAHNMGLGVVTAGRWLLAITLLMMPLNLALETQKWRVAMGEEAALSFGRAYFYVLSALPYGILTPSRIGEWWGRARDLPHRDRGFVLGSLTGIAQQTVTIVMGIAGLIYMGFSDRQNLLIAAFIILIALLPVEYFVLNKRAKWSRNDSNVWIIMCKLLLLSLLRYIVFATQFMFLLKFFSVPGSAMCLYSAIVTGYLVSFLLPLNAFVELGLRSGVMVMILGNKPGVVYATFLIWVINVMVPALVGSILLFWESIKAR